MATRTVTKYRTRTVYKRRSRGRSGGGYKISAGLILGLVPGVAWSFEPTMAGRPLNESLWRLISAYTGYNPGEPAWRMQYLARGLWPLVGGLLAHYLADAFGVNRAISRLHLPVEI